MTDTKMFKILAERERIMVAERELNAKLAELKKVRKPLDVEVEKFLGDDDEVEVSKWIIKRVDRKGYEVKPCSYVQVNVNSRKLVAKKSVAA